MLSSQPSDSATYLQSSTVGRENAIGAPANVAEAAPSPTSDRSTSVTFTVLNVQAADWPSAKSSPHQPKGTDP